MRRCAKVGMGLALLTGDASAQTAASYVTAESSALPLASLSAPQTAISTTENFAFGRSYGATYGYDFGRGFKTEIEGLSSNAASDRLGGLAAGGTLTSTRLTLKGIYEFADGAWRVKPFIGAGFRMIDMNEHIAGLAGNAWTTAYQLRGGVVLGFTQKLVGSLEYRWTNGSRPTFALGGIPTKLEVDRHGFTLGINYKY